MSSANAYNVPFPNDKILDSSILNRKSLQTTILSIMKMAESSPKE